MKILHLFGISLIIVACHPLPTAPVYIKKKVILTCDTSTKHDREMLEQEKEALSESKQDSKRNKKMLDHLEARIENQYLGDAKKEMLTKLKTLRGKNEELLNKEIDLENELSKIEAFFEPSYIEKVIDSLTNIEISNFKSAHPHQNYISKRTLNQLSTKASNKFYLLREEKVKERLAVSIQLREIIKTRNSQAIELQNIVANVSLSNYLWKINNNSYFNTGSATLSYENRVAFQKELSVFFDSVIQRISGVVMDLLLDSLPHQISLKIFIDGFADSQPFKESSIERNQILSQERADIIRKIVLDVWNEKLPELETVRITFVLPEVVSKGNGESYPIKNVYYQTDDSRRRISILQCLFIVED